MIITTSRRAPIALAYSAAPLFTLASGGTTLVYGWHKGTDLPSSVIWAAVSVAVSIVFALSWPAVISSIERRRWSRALPVAAGRFWPLGPLGMSLSI